MNTLPKIALGAWSWGAGAAGGDQVFGNHLAEADLQPVFDKAMECGLNLWDTAAVYGEGSSERILGNFIKDVRREDVIISTKFTPQIASDSPEAMPFAKSGQIKSIGVSNHNLSEIDGTMKRILSRQEPGGVIPIIRI